MCVGFIMSYFNEIILGFLFSYIICKLVVSLIFPSYTVYSVAFSLDRTYIPWRASF